MMGNAIAQNCLNPDHRPGCASRNHSCTCGFESQRDVQLYRLQQENDQLIYACLIGKRLPMRVNPGLLGLTVVLAGAFFVGLHTEWQQRQLIREQSAALFKAAARVRYVDARDAIILDVLRKNGIRLRFSDTQGRAL